MMIEQNIEKTEVKEVCITPSIVVTELQVSKRNSLFKRNA